MQTALQHANPEKLQSFVREKLEDSLLVVVSNREPYFHFVENDDIHWKQSVGGLSTALDPVMQAVGGYWVANGSGKADADVTDESDQIRVPPDDPRYTLQRIYLSEEESEGYYYGFANQALWPLCHNAFTRPLFLQSHWEMYRAVNERFAESVAKIVGERKAVVFVQDYHFALLPRMIKAMCPQAVCAQFWHIPWPPPELFGICPWRKELLDGMLGNDLLGFQVQDYCNNFLETVERELEIRHDAERAAVVHNGQSTRVAPFPISVDFEALSRGAESEPCLQRMESLKQKLRLADKVMLFGIDRLDYTKGIPDRLRAVDLLLERRPEYMGKLVFVQAGSPSRQRIPAYKALMQEVETLTSEINRRYRTHDWSPIVTFDQDLPFDTVLALYRLADVCIVSSLQDGMNLVAKEFVSARVDERGVLALSRFAGAAEEMPDALPINPYAIEDFAEQVHAAIRMTDDEQRLRMRRMRRQVGENNIYTWTMNILGQLSDVG